MIESLEMYNFKSFTDSCLDFTRKNRKEPKNLIAIYGENGSGKSNIVDAFKVLKCSTMTTYYAEMLTDFQSLAPDMLMESTATYELGHVKAISSSLHFKDLPSVLKNTSTINAEEDTKLVYHFQINKVSGSYEITYDDTCKLKSESLYYLINKKRGQLYTIYEDDDSLEIQLNKDIFKSPSIRNELSNELFKLWGRHTFLAIFKQFQEKVNPSYIEKNVSDHLLEVIHEFDKLIIWDKEVKGPFTKNQSLLPDLASGSIAGEQMQQLEKCEEVIYTYFSSLYADIKDVKYKTKDKNGKLDYQLYLSKNINGKLTEIPFYLESNGTKKLLELLQVFFAVVEGNTVIVDEIDNGIHDILMNSIIKNVREKLTGQLIFTTHDTFLLRELPASSAYFINLDTMGNKRILSGNDYETKVLKNNNMQSMYLKGLFNAVPDPLDLDFDDVFEPLCTNIEE